MLAAIILLSKLDQLHLCNYTKLVVKVVQPHVLEAVIISWKYQGEDILIFVDTVNPIWHPFQFKQFQFLVKLSFVTLINKSQGQSLKVVGLNLASPCFSHEQFYVGYLWVRSPPIFFICIPIKGHTENIVYLEVLQN